MWKSFVCFSLLLGYCSAGTASWNEDISVHNNVAVTGIHYSQHESSVYAARKAAAERLQQHQTAALVAGGSAAVPCDTICYQSFSADAGDAETIGQGTVGFAPTAGGATVGSAQKYTASSSRLESSVQNVHGAPIVYPVASTGARSSFSSSSSSRQQSSSSLNGATGGQQVLAPLYSSGVDHGRTHSSVIASGGAREGTYIQPLVFPVPAPQTHASQSSFNERSSQERSVVSRPVVANVVYTAVPVGGATHSSSNNYNTRSSFVAASDHDQQQQQHVQPVLYPAANNDYSRRYVAHQDHQYRQYPAKSNTYVVYAKPVAAPVVQYYAPSRSHVEDASSSSSSSTTYDSAGRVVNLNHAVQPVSRSERVDDQRTQRVESVQTVQRQPDLYPARVGYDQQEHETQDRFEDVVDGASTERTQRVSGYPSSSSSASQRREQAGGVRTGTSYVSNAGTNAGSINRYSSAQSSDAQRRVTFQVAPSYVPVAAAPVSGAGSVSSSQYESASEQQQRHTSHSALAPGGTYVQPVVVQPVPVGGSAQATSSRYASSSAQEQRSNTHSGGAAPGTYYAPTGPLPYGSQYSNTASHTANSAHSSNRYKAAGGAGGFVPYPIANDEMGRRFGATGGAGGYGADTDLHEIMSESESLARLQAQNVHNGAVAGSATFEADNRFGGGADADSLGTMPGGFQRTKSWSSSSKWASEQRYGDDGKPKTYSMLSTAESEKHNINGKTTGYKAATTTLEDDGKVSTYSLHTT